VWPPSLRRRRRRHRAQEDVACFDVLAEAGDVDTETAAFLRKAMAFDPDARFADADEMAHALDILPPFVGLAAAYGDAVELDPDKLRLKRMEEQMQAERRRLDDERRRLEQERQQLASQHVTGAAPPHGGALQPGLSGGPVPLQLGPASIQPLAQPAQGGSRAGLFIGLAGGVLLVGIALVFGKAWLSAKADEATAADAGAAVAVDVAAPPPAPVEAAPAPVVAPIDAVLAAIEPDASPAADAAAVAADDAAAEFAAAADIAPADQGAAAAAVDADDAGAAAVGKIEAKSDGPAPVAKGEAKSEKKKVRKEVRVAPLDPKAAKEHSLADQFKQSQARLKAKADEEQRQKEEALRQAAERKKALQGQGSKGFADELGKGFKGSQKK